MAINEKMERTETTENTSEVSKGENNRICNLSGETLDVTQKNYDTLHIFNLKKCYVYCGAIAGSGEFFMIFEI
jgi:hypothetical protein